MAELTTETLRFIAEHRTDDVRALALQGRKYPKVDLTEALTQIAGWQAAREKIPLWAATEGMRYPLHLSMEQCSSQTTAHYKGEVVKSIGVEYNSLVDLTGGLGIDFSFLAPLFRQSTYVERQPALCELALHNFPLLELDRSRVVQADAKEQLQEMEHVSLIFIDPARRDGHGGKTVAIADCEPNVAALESLLVQKADRVLVKLSPMLDLSLALHELHHVCEAHVVSLQGECKELLLLLDGSCCLNPDEVPVHCVNLLSDGSKQHFCFTRSAEQTSSCPLAPTPLSYLYEPNASLLKAGAFRSLCSSFGVQKLHPNSHLYTSSTLVLDFPGRVFRILAYSGFGKKEVKSLLDGLTCANLTVRNFPASVADLRKRLKLAEGGDRYLFATTLSSGEKALLLCEKETGLTPCGSTRNWER